MSIHGTLKKRRVLGLGALSALVALAVVVSVGNVLAVHDDGLFELDTRVGVDGDQDKKNDPIPDVVGDGNTTDDAPAGDDWENVYVGSGGGGPGNGSGTLQATENTPTPSGAFATSFVEDTFANNNINNGAEPFVALRTPESSFFTGGGSKDTNGIQDGPWKYKVVSDQVPDKNDIVNAFAAAYEGSSDNTIFYFGLDTYSVNGDANAGFWFFRERVHLNPLAPGEVVGTFSGQHRDGDIFVAVAYTQGGRVGDIDVYEWQGDDATGSLVKILEGQDCATVGPDDDVCGVINKLLPDQTFGEDPYFDYANTLVANNPLTPTSYQYESAAFVEFGLDVTAILGQEIGCFTTFLAETRSSQSETAQLKDFAFGSFPICSIDVDKGGETLSKVGDDVDYTITVTNTGRATLYKQSITDTLLGDLTGTDGCGASLAPAESCTLNVPRTVQLGDDDPLPNTVTVVYSEFAEGGLEFTDSDPHEVDLFYPVIAFDKSADAILSKVGDAVNYSLTLDNNSSHDTPDLECTIIDATLGVSKSVTLASGASDTTTVSYTFQAGDPNPFKNTASVSCSPIGFPNLLEENDSWSVNLFGPSILFDKSVSASLSKVGESVDYRVTLNNTSTANTPDLVCRITDPTLGIDKSVTLASGESDTTTQSYTFQAGDADPYNNTASVSCSPIGFPNVLTASDSEAVNLFQPAIAAAKTGDTLSKVGDDVDYTITLSNNSSADTPAMSCTGTDSLLGEVFNGVLPLGDTVLNLSRTVQEGDPDPLVNTVTLNCSPAGFPNVLEAGASHSVNLFQPAIAAAKTGDTLSKVGDDVDYAITLSNNSSADTPAMTCTATDSLLGEVFNGVLPLGDTVLNPSRTVQEGDPDPLDNTVTLNCSPDGFPNVLEASASHSVNLFQPAIAAAKTGDTLSKVGDDVDYAITLSNNSSADTPTMTCTATDSLLGERFNGVLPLGDTVINVSRTVQPGDPDPLVNTVTLNCSPDGFPNVLEASASHSVNLFQPAIAAAKTGDALSKVGDGVDYTITLSNNSSADTPAMTCTATDSLLGEVLNGVLPLGDTVLNLSRTVLAVDPDPLVNTVTLTCSPDGFPNNLTASASHSVELFQPGIAVMKAGDPLSKVGDVVDYVFTLGNNSSADTPSLNCTATDTLLGTVFSGVLPLGNTVVNASRTVQSGDADPLMNTVSMTCSIAGFPNELGPVSYSHTTELFQPAVEVIKTGPETAAIGETITYNFEINNLSSSDSPDLLLDSVIDTVLGDLTATASAAGCSVLGAIQPESSGPSCSFTVEYTIQGTDPSPLVNVVTVHYHPEGFPNDVTDFDDHSVAIPNQGCTPGFWQGGAGSQLWNEVDDPQWVYGGTNPFIHATLFNDFFDDAEGSGRVDSRLDGQTMFQIVSNEGGIANAAEKAARDMVAAYLNESAFPGSFPAGSLEALEAMWYAAVDGGDAGLDAFHNIVGGWNNPASPGFCPLP